MPLLGARRDAECGFQRAGKALRGLKVREDLQVDMRRGRALKLGNCEVKGKVSRQRRGRLAVGQTDTSRYIGQ